MQDISDRVLGAHLDTKSTSSLLALAMHLHSSDLFHVYGRLINKWDSSEHWCVHGMEVHTEQSHVDGTRGNI